MTANMDPAQLSQQLQTILGQIFSQNRMYLASVTASPQDFAKLEGQIEKLKKTLPSSSAPDQTPEPMLAMRMDGPWSESTEAARGPPRSINPTLRLVLRGEHDGVDDVNDAVGGGHIRRRHLSAGDVDLAHVHLDRGADTGRTEQG